MLGKGIQSAGNRKTCRDHPNNSITQIGQNTEKGLGDLRRLVITQSPKKELSTLYKLILFTHPSARAGYDTRSIFKRSLTGLNSEFSFS